MKKIIVITTGGTIAMKYDKEVNGLIPAVNGNDLVEVVPELKNIAEIDVIEFSNVPSGHMTPKMMFRLAHLVDEYANNNDVFGIVITHGTDTLEETAYMLNLLIKTKKPVCITGAMRGASDVGADGPANILASVRVACCGKAKEKGVLVVFNDEIHAANEVVKTHTTSCATFRSFEWGPIGHVYFDKIIFVRQPLSLEKIQPNNLIDNVYLLKIYAGMDADLFKYLAEKNINGLVVEAFGCGNVTPGVKEGIEYVRQKNIPVVLTRRVFSGRVAPLYSYLGSIKSMESLGIILSEGLSGQKSRIKLMLALGVTKDINKLKQIFNN